MFDALLLTDISIWSFPKSWKIPWNGWTYFFVCCHWKYIGST